MITIRDVPVERGFGHERRGAQKRAEMEGVIRILASIPDSNLFVSGSYDGSYRVWDAKDGGEVGKKMVHKGRIHVIVVSRDGKTMASGGSDGIVVWHLENREKIIEWKTLSIVWSLAMSQDSHTLASGHHDGTVMSWNALTGGRIVGPLKLHDGDVDALSFSADDSQIASVGFDGYICMTYSHSGEDVIPPFKAHDQGIRSLVQFLSNGQFITASDDKTIKYWDTSNLNASPLIATSHGHAGYLRRIKLPESGTHLPMSKLTLLSNTRPPSALVALSFDGHYLSTAGGDGKVYIWNLKDVEVVKIIEPNHNDAAKDDASDGPSWLDLPATCHPDMSRDIAEVSHHTPGGAFFADKEELPVGTDKGKMKAEDVTSADGPDSSERRLLLSGLNQKIFQPFRALVKSSKPPTDRAEEPVPLRGRIIAVLMQPAAAPESSPALIERSAGELVTSRSSIHSSGAGPSGHPSQPSFWRQPQSSSPALDWQVTTVAAGRARRVLAGIQRPDPPAKKLPHSVKPDDPKNKPCHKYLLRKQNEHLARRQKLTPTSPGSPTRDTPLPQDPSLLQAAGADNHVYSTNGSVSAYTN
ncbi:hypothetical protein PAXINDRAFT_99757 [Paxillus involutus ATCC 200175]|uniref:Unplaced genomic scaffold PAXINscaffold_17, whole genome shotgun sequence n=1 Tax=Paxillus involutus ATCC 200175 TaxID=664439 RepID=A0A0C9U691_PAXIN|nr:hypothetical protein PAXINDRAFT_99757 [Paxillus involutus ATCC 200175]